MSHSKIFRHAVSALALACLSTAALAAPFTWSYSQSFGSNGTVIGTFTGNDLNGDGLITYINGAGNELIGLSVSFSGPAFTGSFSQAQMTVGGPDSNITEFQYIIGSTNMDAVLPGPPAKPSVVTLATPVTVGTVPADAYLYWTAGSATYDPQGTFKGNATILDTQANVLGDYQTTSQVLVQVAAIPEPSAVLMLTAGLSLIGGRRLQARRKTSGG